jgi:hypothetical protein
VAIPYRLFGMRQRRLINHYLMEREALSTYILFLLNLLVAGRRALSIWLLPSPKRRREAGPEY